MPAEWIWGALFLAFIGGFVLYVLAADTRPSREARPQEPAGRARQALQESAWRATKHSKHHIARDYQVVFSAQVFVNYPFGLRIIFPAEPPGLQSNARRAFQESDYHSWPQAVDDPQLVVKSGRLEFETEEAEPLLGVELQFAGEAFEVTQASQGQALRQDKDVVYAFWLNPLTAKEHMLTAVISRVAARDETTRFELATIPLSVSVTHFPIRLR